MRIKQLYPQCIFNHKIHNLIDDSRKIYPNDVFYVIKGNCHDGMNYLDEAISRGAKTIISEEEIPNKEFGVNYILTNDVRNQLAKDLAYYYRSYLKKIKIIGVTGTNGKTTVTTLLYKYLRYIKLKAALIGTNGIYINNEIIENHNTTPGIVTIYQIIVKCIKEKIKYLFMEVSSQAIAQVRTGYMQFEVIGFTNISREHLNCHANYTDYKYTKALLLKQGKTVILNKDIKDFKLLLNGVNSNVYTYGVSNSDYQIKNIKLGKKSSNFDLIYKNKAVNFSSCMRAKFNVYNLALFIAILDQLNILNYRIFSFLEYKARVEGRMEEVYYSNRKIVIDFAHTPVAVKSVLEFYKINARRILVVIGAAGNRDRQNRSKVAAICASIANHTYFTNDDPYDENEEEIMYDLTYKLNHNLHNFSIIYDRKSAIKQAICDSDEGDVVLILGRGSELFQQIKNDRVDFNDMNVVKEIIKEG